MFAVAIGLLYYNFINIDVILVEWLYIKHNECFISLSNSYYIYLLLFILIYYKYIEIINCDKSPTFYVFFISLMNTTTHLQFSPIRDVSITLSYRIKQNRDSILFCDQHISIDRSNIDQAK